MEQKSAYYITITADQAGQRIDNFLLTYLKTMPKSHVYRILRKGEVRINKKRIKPSYRLQENDQLRVPPMHLATVIPNNVPPNPTTLSNLARCILYEDDQLLIINKPAGIPVHGGHRVKLGIIELLRNLYPKLPQLELAHRLDADTSGCLVLAKKRSVLRELHALLRTGAVRKVYWALTKGHWQKNELRVETYLNKNQLSSGERIVRVSSEGKQSITQFRVLQAYDHASWVEALLETGRTHQIRVHAQFRGHPIAGDEKYGDRDYNKLLRPFGLKRLFLHAYSVEFHLPSREQPIQVSAPLAPDLLAVLKALE